MQLVARICWVCAACLPIIGCTSSYQHVPAGVPVDVSGTYRITPSESWNRANRVTGDRRDTERWTRHGLMLESLTFIGAIRAGETLRATPRRGKSRLTPFRPEMSGAELIELVVEQYREAGVEEFDVLDHAPVAVFGTDGIRLDFTYRNETRLARRGRAYLASRANRLHVIVFDAAKLHYFEAGLEDFESMMQGAVVR